METVQDSNEPKAEQNRVRLFIGQLSWRMILMRLLINGLTLILVAAVVPDIYFVDRTLLSVLLMAVVLGILNVFVKPVVQFLTLPFIFATYGFVIVLINTIILVLLALIFEERFFVGRLIWAIVGGLVMGIVSSLLESLLGLNLPIVPKSELPQAGERATATGPRIFSNILAEDEEPAFEEGTSERTETARSPESSAAVTASMSGEITEPASDKGSASVEDRGHSEAPEELENNRQGDEQ